MHRMHQPVCPAATVVRLKLDLVIALRVPAVVVLLSSPTSLSRAHRCMFMQGLSVMTSYLEGALDKGLADPVQHDEELAHLYLRMALHPPGKSLHWLSRKHCPPITYWTLWR